MCYRYEQFPYYRQNRFCGHTPLTSVILVIFSHNKRAILSLSDLHQQCQPPHSLPDLWNPEFQCLNHKGSAKIPILSRFSPIPHIDTCFLNIYSNICEISRLMPAPVFPFTLPNHLFIRYITIQRSYSSATPSHSYCYPSFCGPSK